MKDAAKESSLVLANLVSFWRDMVLRSLPSSFLVPDKMILRGFSLDSKFLFDDLKLSQAINNAEKVTWRSFQESAAEALRRNGHHQLTHCCSPTQQQSLSLLSCLVFPGSPSQKLLPNDFIVFLPVLV